jgi:hypothetical protein
VPRDTDQVKTVTGRHGHALLSVYLFQFSSGNILLLWAWVDSRFSRLFLSLLNQLLLDRPSLSRAGIQFARRLNNVVLCLTDKQSLLNSFGPAQMSFARYLRKNYSTACEMQRNIVKDSAMVEMLNTGRSDLALVKSWMREYGLFQGITTAKRNAIAKAFLNYALNLEKPRRALNEKYIEAQFKALLLILHKKVERSWMSATSKLLWCVFPHEFVIYDAFVHRSLVVLQCVDSGLSKFPRVGAAPKIKGTADIDDAVSFYMNYQSMVRHLQKRNQPALDTMRAKHAETYEYDVRIIDKILWMIGNARTEY